MAENTATVHEVADLVPRNRMGTFVANQCPGRRVHARVAGQRSVVEVDREPPRQIDDCLRQEAHIGDAEEIVEWPRLERDHQIFRQIQWPHTPLLGPAYDLGIRGNDPQHLVPPADQDVTTLNGESALPNHKTAESPVSGRLPLRRSTRCLIGAAGLTLHFSR